MITIAKSTWHYQVYAWTHRWNDKKDDEPTQIDAVTSLCEYRARILFYTPLCAIGFLWNTIMSLISLAVWLVYTAIKLVLGTILYLPIVLLRFLFGSIPSRGIFGELLCFYRSGAEDLWEFRTYRPFKLGLVDIYPWTVILAGAAVFYIKRNPDQVLTIVLQIGAILTIAGASLEKLILFLATLWKFGLVIIGLCTIYGLLKTNLVQRIFTRIRKLQERFMAWLCPEVTFVD